MLSVPQWIGICLLVVPILYFLFRRPEVALGLFIAAYVIKGGMDFGVFNPTMILLGVSIVGFVLPLAAGRRASFTFHMSDLLLLLFVAVLLSGSYLAPNSQEGFLKAGRFLAAVFVPYLLARVFLQDWNQIRLLLATILSVAVIVGAVLIVLSLSGTYAGGRLSFMEVNAIALSTLLAMGLVIAVIGAVSNQFGSRSHGRLLLGIVAITLAYSILLTGIRGPLIAATLGLGFYFMTLKLRRKVTIALGLGGILLLFIAINHYFLPLFHLEARIPNVSLYSLSQVTGGTSTLLRLDQYSAAVDIFREAPLFGIGTGGYSQVTGVSYPHNIFLEIAAENGIIGLVTFCAFLTSVAWCGLRFILSCMSRLPAKESAIGVCVLAVAITLLIEKQFSYGLAMNKDLFVFLALAVSLPQIARSGSVRKLAGS